MDYKPLVRDFSENGFCKIENFLTNEEVEELRQGMQDEIENMTEEDVHVHSAYSDPKRKSDEEYYINSGDKVAYFFEADAFDEEGNLLVDKKEALNKIAYALHWWSPKFKKITFSEKIKDLLRNFGYKEPVVTHSMLIFKKPKIGEIFPPHQDSTFLYSEPPTCFGIWLPLEDATIENGCLWFLPGSHKNGIYRRYVRNPEKEPFMIMKGEIPEHDQSKYVPVPAKKGDCVLIHGSVLHKSNRNHTEKARVAYTFHVIERDSEWSKDNWLQPTERLPFPSVYAN